MGTRATIQIKDGNSKLLTIYSQYDGYLSGIGKTIWNYLKDHEVVNGFSRDMTLKTHFNGMSELAAYLLTQLKTETMTLDSSDYVNGKFKKKKQTHAMGIIYVVPHSQWGHEEFNYLITLKDGRIHLRCEDTHINDFIDNLKDIDFED